MASEQQVLEPVYFFCESKRESKLLKNAQIGLNWAYLAGFSLILFVLMRLCITAGLGMPAAILITVLSGLIAIPVLHIANRRHALQFQGLAAEPPGTGDRLACVGDPRQLGQCSELADLHFEPAFFSTPFAQPFSTVMQFLALFLTIAVTTAVHYATVYPTFGSINDWSHFFIGKICAGFTVAVGIVGWLWPTYFRIVPGRLDVLRFNNLLNRPVSVEHYNLRTAKLLIDLRRGVIFIDAADGRAGEFPIVWMRRSTRESLAYHVLLAALSTHQTPMLPDDRLLG